MDELGHDIDALEERIKVAIEDLKSVDSGLLEAVLEDIRRPGWTTSAEYVFAFGITETLIEHLGVVRRLQGTLIAGARRVSTS
ncbi:hypothetical protein B1729_15215 [Microbacterium sp. B35-04]|uniref:hypothetical protein n=1 Tax=unclassified Microbacterium TaxID=2609290 RepID=UPI0013D46106|nr:MULTISPECIES: hypothetical protein [unclassified Microbacterium]KAF2412396.1 hypothetical protein B1729_15215 [Microbacterium sp. B35-04]KAF2415979.1 hypothetical protein B2K11_17705 [Microbacterium sp. B35-30]